MTITVRGVTYEENLSNAMGLEFYDLSHPWGLNPTGLISKTSKSSGCTAWPSRVC